MTLDATSEATAERDTLETDTAGAVIVAATSEVPETAAGTAPDADSAAPSAAVRVGRVLPLCKDSVGSR